jgi:uncharacterized protein YkwD
LRVRMAVAVTLMTTFSLSAFAEDRSSRRTDLERMAAELRNVLGAGSVEVQRRGETQPRGQTQPRAPERPRETAAPAAASWEGAIIAEMNRERARRGLTPLSGERRLDYAARDRMDDMFARRYFNHVDPDGRDPFWSMRSRGYRYLTAGENLASGYQSPQAVVAGWMESKPHREAILSPQYRDVGLSIRSGSPDLPRRGVTVVALYGTERG